MCKEAAITISIKPVLVGVAMSWVRRCMVIVWLIKGMHGMPQIMMSLPALIAHALMVPLWIPWRSCYTFMAHWRSMWLFLTQLGRGRWKWNSQVWKISSKQVELVQETRGQISLLKQFTSVHHQSTPWVNLPWYVKLCCKQQWSFSFFQSWILLF